MGQPGFTISDGEPGLAKGRTLASCVALTRLRQNGVPFHVICVIGARSLDAVDELMDFFIAEGIRDVGFNIEEIEGVNRRSTLQQDDIDTRFREFFARLLDRARAADPPSVDPRARGAACHAAASVVWASDTKFAE